MTTHEQIKYESIVCIYTSHEHVNTAIKLKNTLPQRPELKYFIFTATGYVKDNIDDDSIVVLDANEGYELLSLKTYQMLKYVHQLNVDFKNLYKIDATVYTQETCIGEEEQLETITKQFFSRPTAKQYDGARPCSCGRIGMNAWLRSKKISNFTGTQKKWYDTLSKSEKIFYYSGKFYTISREFLDFIINDSRIEKLSQLLSEEWGGVEDMMIGFLWEDYNQRDK